MEEEENDDDELKQSAAKLRRLFTLAKRKQGNPAFKPRGRAAEPGIWMKAAKMVRENGADEEDWVNALFDQCTDKLPGAPYPKMLSNKHAENCYKNYIGKSGDTGGTPERDMVAFDLGVLETAIRSEQRHTGNRDVDVEKVLLDPFNRIPSYVRVAVAWKEGWFPRVLERYLDDAKKEVFGSRNKLDILEEMGYPTDIFHKNPVDMQKS